MKLGYIGLGKMGKNMVLHLLEQGVEVVAWNRSPEPLSEVVKAGAVGVKDIPALVNKLEIASPSTPRNDGIGRVIWLMLPAGETTDQFIDQLIPLLSEGDLVIDGANSFYKDTLSRAEKLKEKGIHFMDIGVSGGPKGARTGACLMIGGSKEDFERVEELAKLIAAPNAYGHFGDIGAGHFAKMVHNGIEYGMMQAIAEGAAILKNSHLNLNLAEIFRVYNNKSVIESRLVGWAKETLEEDPELSEYSSKIGHTGEGEWTVKTGEELEVGVPVLKDSFEVRVNSEKDPEDSPNGFRNKLVSALRGKFGQHKVKKD